MKRTLPFLLYPALGLLAGWASTAIGRKPTITQPPPRAPAHQREARDASPPWTAADFHKAARDRSRQATARTRPPLQHLLADWTDDEVLAALNEAIEDPLSLTRTDAIWPLIGEAMRRDLSATIAWFDGIPAIQQVNLLHAMCDSWPADRLPESIDFLLKRKELLSNNQAFPTGLLSKIIALRAATGPAPVIALLRMLREEGFRFGHGAPPTYPPGFDFIALLGAEEMRDPALGAITRSAITAWMRQDRDAAFGWVAGHGNASQILSLAPLSMDASGDHEKWFLTRLETIPRDMRDEVMAAKAREWIVSPHDAERWLKAAPTPELRRELHTALGQGLYTGQGSSALLILSGFPEEERLDFLETLVPLPAFASEVKPLPEKQLQSLRNLLSRGKADPARVDAIVRHFQNPLQP